MQKYLNRVDLAKSFPWEYLLPNIGFDTAENEVREVCCMISACEPCFGIIPNLDIHDEIFKAHQDMCKDGRMDSEHCAKFRETLDTMHKEILS